MAKSLLVLISGSSGAGKSTIINKLVEKNNNYRFLPSLTSREVRADDRVDENGNYIQYSFVTKEEFEQKIKNKEMLEYDIFSDNYYGISKERIKEEMKQGNILLKDITVKGIISCQENLGSKIPMATVFFTVNKGILKKRLVARKTKDIKKRLKVYNLEQSKIPLYDYCIENNEQEYTMEIINAIVNIHTNKLPILAYKSCQNILNTKIDRIIKKIEKNRKTPPIKLFAKNNRIYILEGLNTYLAYKKLNKSTVKYFVEPPANFEDKPDNYKEWEKIEKIYALW